MRSINLLAEVKKLVVSKETLEECKAAIRLVGKVIVSGILLIAAFVYYIVEVTTQVIKNNCSNNSINSMNCDSTTSDTSRTTNNVETAVKVEPKESVIAYPEYLITEKYGWCEEGVFYEVEHVNNELGINYNGKWCPVVRELANDGQYHYGCYFNENEADAIFPLEAWV